MNSPAPTSHHPEGPSSWPMWSDCPDFEGTGKDIEDLEAALLDAETGEAIPQAEDTGAAAKALGTLQHAALASIYTPDAEARATAFALLTDRQAEDVRWVAAKVNEIAEGLGYQSHELRVERRVTMFKGESFEVLYFGTVDVEAGPTIIFDAKFGLVRDYFAQMVGYLLPKLVAGGHRLGHAYTVYGRARKVQSYAITLDTAEAVAYGILAKRLDPNRRPRACQYCGWCAKKAGCAAITVQVADVVERREDWALKLPQVHASLMTNDPVAIGAAKFIWKAYLEPWGKAVDYVAKGMEERGITPAGFFRQKQKGSVIVTKPTKAMDILREAGVVDEASLGEIPVSMTDLVRACMKSLGIGETAAKSKIFLALEGKGVLAQGEASFKLVRAKDGEAQIRAALGSRVEMKLTQEESTPLGITAPEGAGN